MKPNDKQSGLKNWKFHGWMGLALMLVFWIINWSLKTLHTHWAFFPLWIGYCLTVDALVFRRKGSSLLTRNLKKYIGLFIVSAPAWWLFELINKKTLYWHYDGREFFTNWEYFIFATINFSTVIPAVLGTSEFVSTSKWIKINRGPKIGTNKKTTLLLFVFGWIMLAMVLLKPQYSAAFMWISIYFILDPVNVWLGNRSLLQYTAQRNWNPAIALGLGSIICGFFWELWNYFSYPKWYYHVPGVDFWHVFEMPLLGYLGYIPFAFELFALYHLIYSLFTSDKSQKYIQID